MSGRKVGGRRLLLLDGLPDSPLWLIPEPGSHELVQFPRVCIAGRGMAGSGTSRKEVGEHGADGMREVCYGEAAP